MSLTDLHHEKVSFYPALCREKCAFKMATTTTYHSNFRTMTIAIKDFMSAPVISCTIEANIGQVRDLMEMKGFSAVPVVQINDDTYTVKGIVTYRDIAGVYDDNVNVQQIMTQQLKVIPPDTNAQEAAGIMQQFGIHHLVAVEDDRIVGLVSSADFVKLVSSYQLC